VLKEKKWQLQILCLIKLSSRNGGKSNKFPEGGKLKEFVAGRPLQNQWPKEFFNQRSVKENVGMSEGRETDESSIGRTDAVTAFS
jgi:hypothetical protein